MNSNNIPTQNTTTLQAAQQIIDTRLAPAVDALGNHRCLSYLVLFPTDCSWMHDLDIAVRLYLCRKRGDGVEGNRMYCTLMPQFKTSEMISAARNAVAHFVSAMKTCRHPFAIIFHVEGDGGEQFDCFGYTEGQAMGIIAQRLSKAILGDC
jgi:hypothetical protein